MDEWIAYIIGVMFGVYGIMLLCQIFRGLGPVLIISVTVLVIIRCFELLFELIMYCWEWVASLGTGVLAFFGLA